MFTDSGVVLVVLKNTSGRHRAVQQLPERDYHWYTIEGRAVWPDHPRQNVCKMCAYSLGMGKIWGELFQTQFLLNFWQWKTLIFWARIYALYKLCTYLVTLGERAAPKKGTNGGGRPWLERAFHIEVPLYFIQGHVIFEIWRLRLVSFKRYPLKRGHSQFTLTKSRRCHLNAWD